MLLLLPLLPALTAPLVLPASRVDRDALALALDPECAMVVLVGDLTATTEGSGQWLELVRDPEWLEVLEGFAALEDEEEAAEDDPMSPSDFFARFSGLIGRVRGGALGLLGEDEERMQALLEVDEGWLEQYATAVEEGAHTTTDEQGRIHFEWIQEDSEAVLVGLQVGTRVVLAGESGSEAALATCEALLENLASGAGAAEKNPWWTGCEARCADPLAELFLDGGKLAEDGDIEEMREVLGVPELLYFGLEVGPGREGELVLRMELADAPVFDLLASCTTEADLSLLRFVTDGYVGTVFGLDVDAAVEAGVELAERTSPGAREQFENGVQAANAVLGVDLREDFWSELTGQVLMLRKVPDFADLASAVEQEDASGALEVAVPTFAFTIGDEDSILSTLEPLMKLIQTQGISCESRDIEEGAFWTLDPGLGTPLGVGVGHGFLVVGLEASALELLAMAGGGGPKGYLSSESLTGLEHELDGQVVSVAPLEETLASIESMGDFVEQFAESEQQSEVMVLLARGAALARRHLSGLVGMALEFESGIAMRIVTR